MRYKVAIRFRVEGDLRFISHHDTMRLFERALSRARLPVKYSEGFNPRVRMSLPLPRPVGVATSADMLVVELREPLGASEVLGRLREQMPGGLTLLEAFDLPSGGKLHPESVGYEAALPEEEIASVRSAVGRLMAADRWLVDRNDEQGRLVRAIDLRPMLIDASVEGGVLRWSCRVSDEGAARLAEWLSAFGLDPARTLHRVRRTAVEWQARPLPGAVAEPAEAAGV
ncbi:MAG: DUF2344 domain-containing protein [Phycisphaerae bacterium]